MHLNMLMMKGGMQVRWSGKWRVRWRPWIYAALCLGIVLDMMGDGLWRAAYAEEASLHIEFPPPDNEERTQDTGFMVEVIHPEVPAQGAGKRILIYHTHTYEAYEQDESHPYAAIEKWRTSDANHNIIAVGRALAADLTALGHEVTHDTTAFEPPNLDDAYTRSLQMLELRRERGEQYDLYIDLHRDAIASNSTIKRTVTIGGAEVARFMALVGKGTTGGYREKPNWEANLVYAERITTALNAQCASLARDTKIKTGRFNQHIADCCVLIECGTNWNTLDEVIAGIPYLAQAISQALATQ